jgi:hypothetical protein
MNDDLPEVFAALKKLLRPHLGRLAVTRDNPKDFLMPAYLYPDLAKAISPELKRRKQGKSCFNLTKVDGALLRELQELTNAGIKRFRSQGLPKPG